jgi:cytochrome bd ubiquinol oxidase subunit II
MRREPSKEDAVETLWFCVLAVLGGGYAVLDGFDLGVGALHLWVARNDDERRTALLAIGPVWDGNEVWLIATGGLLVLSFPRVYAAGFSGFYLALMTVLWLLMGRGLAIEWRANVQSPMWKQAADVIFSGCSALLALFFGIAVGNIVNGVPLNPQGYYQGLFAWMLNPYAVLVGLLSVALLAMHGANWLSFKTEGPVQERARLASRRLFPVVVLLIVLVTIGTFLSRSAMGDNYHNHPIWLIAPIATVLVIAAQWRFRAANADLSTWLASAALLLTLLVSTAIGLYPYLLPSNPHPARSLTIHNAYSSHFALQAGITWLAIGAVLAIAHTSWVYYLFRGKVDLKTSTHY